MAAFSQRTPAFVDITMIAHPSVTLLVDLSDGDLLVYGSPGRRVRGNGVVGLSSGNLRAVGRVGACLQIRLGPVAAAAVLGPSAELYGTVESFADVWGHDAERVEDRLRAAVSWDERFAIASEALGRRIADRRRPVDAEVVQTWRRTLATRGRVRINDLAAEVGWGRKRLSARFRSQLGITPKRAAQLVRFDHAAHLLAAGLPPAQVAATTGYVDQPHLHREVKAFGGLTPAGLATAPWLAIDGTAWRRHFLGFSPWPMQ